MIQPWVRDVEETRRTVRAFWKKEKAEPAVASLPGDSNWTLTTFEVDDLDVAEILRGPWEVKFGHRHKVWRGHPEGMSGETATTEAVMCDVCCCSLGWERGRSERSPDLCCWTAVPVDW